MSSWHLPANCRVWPGGQRLISLAPQAGPCLAAGVRLDTSLRKGYSMTSSLSDCNCFAITSHKMTVPIDRFAGQIGTRYEMDSPVLVTFRHSRERAIWATDGACALRLPADDAFNAGELTVDFNREISMPNVGLVLDQCPTASFHFEPWEKMLAVSCSSVTRCPRCNGNGVIGRHVRDCGVCGGCGCPVCHLTGKVNGKRCDYCDRSGEIANNEKPVAERIGSRCVSLYYTSMIRSLSRHAYQGLIEVAPEGAPSSSAFFRFRLKQRMELVEIAVMPLKHSNDYRLVRDAEELINA